MEMTLGWHVLRREIFHIRIYYFRNPNMKNLPAKRPILNYRKTIDYGEEIDEMFLIMENVKKPNFP